MPELPRLLRLIDGDPIDEKDSFPPALRAQLRRSGALRARLPKAHGGLGWTHERFGRLVAAAAERSLAVATLLTTQQSTGLAPALELFGTAEQRARWLRRLAGGALAALAVGEEAAGSNIGATRARARRVGGAWRLEGRKGWVVNAASAGALLVLARSSGGLSAFVVGRGRGVSSPTRVRFMGLRGLEVGALALRGAAGELLGSEGDGARIALASLAAGRAGFAARALGLSRACAKAARAWAESRKLLRFPGAAASVAHIESILAALEKEERALSAAADSGRLLTRAEAARAKIRCAEAAWEIADAALELRGVRGYETARSQAERGERPVGLERMFRDARALRLMEGSDEVLRSSLER